MSRPFKSTSSIRQWRVRLIVLLTSACILAIFTIFWQLRLQKFINPSLNQVQSNGAEISQNSQHQQQQHQKQPQQQHQVETALPAHAPSETILGLSPTSPSPVSPPSLHPESPLQSHTALVSLADPKFQMCSLQLVKKARQLRWTGAIILLAIEYNRFSDAVIKEFETYGVGIIHTLPVFDAWLSQRIGDTRKTRQLDVYKMRKIELFLNPYLRTYRRLIYVDPDGFLDSSLDPMVHTPFPQDKVVMLRQNDRAFKKGTLWKNEMIPQQLTSSQRANLEARFPDREMAGASSWLIVDVPKLPPPPELFEKSLEILCSFLPGFRLNDQTLLNLLFYNSVAFIPWCSLLEIKLQTTADGMKEYCDAEMQAQRETYGGLKFLYRHMEKEEKSVCLQADPDAIDGLEGEHLEIGSWRRGIFEQSGVILKPSVTDKAFQDMSCIDALKEWQNGGAIEQE